MLDEINSFLIYIVLPVHNWIDALHGQDYRTDYHKGVQ